MEQSLREKLTFAQAEGKEALPQRLKIKEVSRELRARLWAALYTHVDNSCQYGLIHEPWLSILVEKHVKHDHNMIDTFERNFPKYIKSSKAIFISGSYIDVFGPIQFIIRHKKCPDSFKDEIHQSLQDTRAAYKIINNTIVPIASEQEGQAIESAIDALSEKRMMGAREHLLKASRFINEGQWADSIRESIHAVEAAARKLEPSTHTLAPALKALEKKTHLHPALAKGFGSLYGFTNDEEGIRHPLIDEPVASVDEADALYMLGSCASFVTYMLSK